MTYLAAGERMMVNRLKQGARTKQDLNFYRHELLESRLIGKYRRMGLSDIDAARGAHMETLARQGMYRRGYETEMYTPGALRARDADWSSE
jgi:hypothetical protein